MKRFIGILENPQKPCKVLQKSRFGRSTTDGKISLRGKLGAMLTVIWLVRVQVGAKIGKLTLLGGLRGTNLELKGALRGSKSVLRAPKSAPRASQERQKWPPSS